jgi:outer membrane protein assembly factor BamD (BamD/ComL family)
LACISLFIRPCLQAQEITPPAQQAPEGKPRLERKTLGWFRHPRKTTPAEQMKFADEMLASGYQREAAKQYNALVCVWPESSEAPAAQMAYAKILEDREDYVDAFDEFQYLIDHFAGRFPFEEALDRQFRIANTLMTQKHGRILFGGYKAPERALPLFEQIVKNGPQWKNTSQAQFYVGTINEDMQDYGAAIKAYEAIPFSSPDSAYVEEASFRRAHCLYVQANATPRNEPSYREALSALSMFQRDFPNSSYAESAGKYLDELKERLARLHYDRALFYDRIAKRPQAAVIAYADFIRNFPGSVLATEASDRMDTLKLEMEKKK